MSPKAEVKYRDQAQSVLPEFGDGVSRRADYRYTPLDFKDMRRDDELRAWNIGPEWLGENGEDVAADDYRRYQYDRMYFFPVRKGNRTEYHPVEFRTYVNWIGELTESLREHIRETVNARLRTLFNTDVYEHYMDEFNFLRHATNVEHDRSTQIAEDEAMHLGIPQWQVFIIKNGDKQGAADGFFDPFRAVEYAPRNEIWNVTKNPARGTYEVRPQGAARNRLEGQRKEVFVNGKFVGNTSPSRGTVEIKTEYDTKSGRYKDSRTGRDMHSRETLKQAGMHANELVKGGQVYKVNESKDKILLVTSKRRTPDEFDPTPPESFTDEMVQGAFLELNDAHTAFVVRNDTGPMLGRYDPPTVRDIEYETEFDTIPIGAR